MKDVPDCGPANCEGCCWHYGAGFVYCTSGFDDTLCGRHGESCQACDTSHGGRCASDPNGLGGSCQGTPPPCSPTTCNGCCYGQICATGAQDIACVDCFASALTCSAGACGN